MAVLQWVGPSLRKAWVEGLRDRPSAELVSPWAWAADPQDLHRRLAVPEWPWAWVEDQPLGVLEWPEEVEGAHRLARLVRRWEVRESLQDHRLAIPVREEQASRRDRDRDRDRLVHQGEREDLRCRPEVKREWPWATEEVLLGQRLESLQNQRSHQWARPDWLSEAKGGLPLAKRKRPWGLVEGLRGPPLATRPWARQAGRLAVWKRLDELQVL